MENNQVNGFDNENNNIEQTTITESINQLNPKVNNSVVNENNSLSTNSNTVNKKKKLILPILIFIILLIVLIVGYFILCKGPKKVFDKTISNSVNYLKENLDNNKHDNVEGTASFNYEITSPDSSLQKAFDMFNGISMEYEYAIDYKNKLMNIDLTSTYKNDKLLDFQMYGESDKFYVLLKNIYSKYISIDFEEYDEIFNSISNQDELEVILNSMEKALKSSLEKDDFTKTEETIKIADKEIKTTKNILVLNNKKSKRIAKTLLTKLKDDTEFVDAVKKVNEDDSIDVKTELEELIKNIDESENSENDTTIEISIYTKGLFDEFVKADMVVKDSEDNVKFSLTKTSEDNYDFEAVQDKTQIFIGSIKMDVNNSDKSAKSDVEIMIQIPNTINIKLNIKSSSEFDKQFNKIDVTNSIDYNQLTDTEMNNITTKLMENKGLANLSANLQALFGNLIGSGYDYEYSDSYDTDLNMEA